MKNKLYKSLYFSLFVSTFLFGRVLTLEEAYTLTIQNSNELKSINYQVDAKKEDINQVKSRFYPQVNFSLSYNKMDYTENYFSKEVEEQTTEYAITLRQMIYNHESYTSLDVEKKKVELYGLKMEAYKKELSKVLIKSYMEALKSKNKIRLLEGYMKFYEEKFHMAQNKYELNLLDKTEFLKTKVELEKIKIEMIKEKNLYSLYEGKLKRLTNLEDIEIPSIQSKYINISFFPDIAFLKQIKSEKIIQNLDLIQANKSIELSLLETKNASSGHLPKLLFDARYTKYNTDDSTVDYEDYKKYTLELQIPLYQGGATVSKVQSMKLLEKAYREDYEKVKKDLEIEFDDLIGKMESAYENIKVYKEAIEATQSYLDFVSLGYEKGLKNSTEFLEAKNKMLDLEYEYVQNIEEYINVYTSLMVLSGDVEKLDMIDEVIKSTQQ